MPSLLRGGYAPPGVYTQTSFGLAQAPVPVPNQLPVLVGTGVEILSRTNLPVVRGSSSTIDQQIFDEDESGRAVVSVASGGLVTLGAFDGLLTKLQVRNIPLVSGDGTGTLATDTSVVSVSVNGFPVVVLGLDAAKGIVELSVAPAASDVVVCTYYFDRTDTLTLDDVSAQVTSTYAVIDSAAAQNYSFTAGANDVLNLSVDGLASVNITMPSAALSVSGAVVAATINSASGIGSLVATTFVDNLGNTRVRLTAGKSVAIGTGTANTALGFVPGATTSRNRTFYVFNGPVVDGNGGGLTTTDPANVVVLVNGTQVIPTSVDGSTRAVTLAVAPAPGSTVTVRYYFNTWQDTFDYLANVGVTEITLVSPTAGGAPGNVYVGGVSYVLKDDVIVWGTAALVSAGVHTDGAATFGTSQVTAMLVDNRAYLAACAATTNTSGPVAVASTTVFQLPYQPTTGNGRGNPLPASLYQTVANGRMDLPTTRPDLVLAYWGFGVLDALERGPVTVLKVDSDFSQITLASAVPEGANVYATFYYNTLVDAANIGSSSGYTLTCVTAGAGGFGTYSITSPSGGSLFGANLVGKGSDLSTVTVAFPSGSEFFPDSRIEGGTPVEESVTVEFATSDETPARFTAPSPGPYYPIENTSDRFRITFGNIAANTGLAGGIDLSAPTGVGAGVFASVLGTENPYTAASGELSYDLTAGVDDEVNLFVDGVSIAASTGTVPGATAATWETAINTAAVAPGNEPYYETAGAFTSFVVAASNYDRLSLYYTGAATSGTQTIALTVGTYASLGALVAEINVQLATINGGGGLLGTVVATGTSNGTIRFTLTLAGGDTAGYLEFLADALPARDFAIVAGISTSALPNQDQVKLYNGPIARVVGNATTAGRRPYDRLVLRNRLLTGGGSMSYHSALGQTSLKLLGGSGATKSGLANGGTGEAAYGANVKAPSILSLFIGEGQNFTFLDARDGQQYVTLYDGTVLTSPANNYFAFTAGGNLIGVTLVASGTGTVTAIGPATAAGSLIGQINAAISALGLSALVTAVQEGSYIRIVGGGVGPTATLVIGSGSANATLGFNEDDSAAPVAVSAKQLASTLMSHAAAAIAFAGTTMRGYQTPDANYFAGRALASVQADTTGNDYLYIECDGALPYGVGSSIKFNNANTNNVLVTGTQLFISDGEGASGEAAINGYFVTSSNPANGSGSANTSVLNLGVGQDGFVGQTYRDAVTGLTFTVLPRAGAIPYPTGSNATMTFRVSRTFTTDGNIPTLAVLGVELTVTNTASITVGDTVLVETFKKDGDSPSIGEVYYVSYNYAKQDFSPKLFARLSGVVAEYGPVSPDNPISLAAYLAFMNGASVLATYQVRKTAGSNQASEQAYMNALVDLEGASLPGNLNPTVLCLLTPATTALAKQTALHCDMQSSIRYRSERTAIFGFASGTQPLQAGAISTATASTRVRFVYPDIATVTLTDVLGASRDYLVDGRYLASTVAAATTSQAIDPATPWTGRQLSGFTALQRRLDAVEANQVASRGVTVVEDRLPFLRIRHGLTSDMSNVLTKTPTVIQIADEMQKRCRSVLDPFVGTKFLPQSLGQIEGRLSVMFKQAVAEQIITSFTGISVLTDPEDPTALLVSAYYVPVFPLLYLQISLRVSAQSSV